MVSLWCLLYVIAVWAGCQLTPVVGDWVFAIPAAGCVGYWWLLRRHRRKWHLR